MISKSKESSLPEEREIILTEYQCSQSSAEHYNTMTWTLTSLILAFSLLVLKTILIDINQRGWQFDSIGKLPIIQGILISGTLAWVYFGYLIEGANQKKKWKYEVCKNIEKGNSKFFGNNLGTEHLPFTKKERGLMYLILIKMDL